MPNRSKAKAGFPELIDCRRQVNAASRRGFAQHTPESCAETQKLHRNQGRQAMALATEGSAVTDATLPENQ